MERHGRGGNPGQRGSPVPPPDLVLRMAVPRRPGERDDLTVFRVGGTGRAERRGFHMQSQDPGPLPPRGHEFGQARFRLPPSGAEHRHLRRRRGIGEIPVLEVPEDLPPSPGERVEMFLAVTGELEPRHPPDEPRRHRVAEPHEPGRQFVAVVGPRSVSRSAGSGSVPGSSSPRCVPRHVGHDAVGMELGVEVPAGQVAESRAHHAVGRDSRPALGGRVPAPGLEEFPLDPVQGLAHRPIMGADHPPVAMDQRLQGDRLGGRQGDVPTRAVDMLAVHLPPEPDAGARHLAREHRLEPLRVDMAAQAQCQRRLPVPETRPAVLGIVLRVVAVLLVVFDRGRGGAEFRYRSDHQDCYSGWAGQTIRAGKGRWRMLGGFQCPPMLRQSPGWVQSGFGQHAGEDRFRQHHREQGQGVARLLPVRDNERIEPAKSVADVPQGLLEFPDPAIEILPRPDFWQLPCPSEWLPDSFMILWGNVIFPGTNVECERNHSR